MVARGAHRGNPITFDEVTWRWLYGDGVRVDDDPERACGRCGRESTLDGHDRCLGTLPGVMNACCGHGADGEAYVEFWDGTRFGGEVAIAFFAGVRESG